MGFTFNSKNRDSAPVMQYEIAAPKHLIAVGSSQNPIMAAPWVNWFSAVILMSIFHKPVLDIKRMFR
jgi:hypothetical protein